MANRRKKRHKRARVKQKQQQPLSLPELEDRAKDTLANHHFKDAISDYKALLQQEKRPEWVTALADAYRGRVDELLNKGMVKEAIAIWENRAAVCGCPLADPLYFRLLLAVGSVDQAAVLYCEHRESLAQLGGLAELRTSLAAQAMAGYGTLLERLPSDDPVVTDYPLAMEALQAYCSGDDTTLASALQRIPFRSPYRDLRQVLKALSVIGDAPDTAASLLERISDHSPFADLVAAAKTLSLSGTALFQRLKTLDKEARQFVTASHGWSEQQRNVMQELLQLDNAPTHEALLRFLLRHQASFGECYARAVGLKLLISHPDAHHRYTKAFGKPSPFEHERIQALQAEQSQEPLFLSYEHWLEAVHLLEQERSARRKECALKAALILRRVAEQCLDFQHLKKNGLKALERSLVHDPDDLPSYMVLIKHYNDDEQLKQARRVLNTALQRYPENCDVLTAAMELSVASESFKKATGYARKILAIDPINSKVRELLVDAHLGHACKQIKQRKLDLAFKELDQADEWARSAHSKGRIELLRGVTALVNGDRASAQTLMQRGNERLGGGLVGQLQVLLEADRAGQPMVKTLKQAGLSGTPRKPDQQTLMALIRAINELWEKESTALKSAIDHFATPLKQCSKLPFSCGEFELICETLGRLGEQAMRARYAQAATKQWPDTPVFVYHYVDANQDSFFGRVFSHQEMKRLEKALQQAEEQGDTRTVQRIAELLERHFPFAAPPSPLPYENDAGDMLGELGNISDIIGLDNTIDRLINSFGPKQVRELEQELGPDGLRQFIKLMIENGGPGKGFGEDEDGFDGASPFGNRRKKTKRNKAGRGKGAGPHQLDLF